MTFIKTWLVITLPALAFAALWMWACLTRSLAAAVCLVGYVLLLFSLMLAALAVQEDRT